MSIIKTEQFEVAGKTYTKQMTYRSGGKFEIKVPTEIGEAIHLLRVAADTEKACDQSFVEAVLQFASLRQKKDKVILYRIDLGGKIKDARGKIVFNRGHFTDDRGVEIKFDYAVANRFKYGDHVTYCDDEGKKIWIGGESEMDWTPEREAFFAGFQAAMEKAILRADSFFGQNSKKLSKLIDSKKLPLLLGGPRD